MQYQRGEAPSSVFIGRDVYHETDAAPDYVNDLDAVLSSAYVDTQNDWMVMANKSFVECEASKCQINMHFMRMQQTTDKYKDHQIDWEQQTRFKAVAWFYDSAVRD